MVFPSSGFGTRIRCDEAEGRILGVWGAGAGAEEISGVHGEKIPCSFSEMFAKKTSLRFERGVLVSILNVPAGQKPTCACHDRPQTSFHSGPEWTLQEWRRREDLWMFGFLALSKIHPRGVRARKCGLVPTTPLTISDPTISRARCSWGISFWARSWWPPPCWVGKAQLRKIEEFGMPCEIDRQFVWPDSTERLLHRLGVCQTGVLRKMHGVLLLARFELLDQQMLHL